MKILILFDNSDGLCTSIAHIRAIKAKKNKIIADSHTAKAEFIARCTDEKFENAHGYVISPMWVRGLGIERRLVTVLFIRMEIL
jgi:hypothetical protein